MGFIAAGAHAEVSLVDAGAPFGALPLLDEIECSNPQDIHPFRESAAGSSRIVRIMNQACRVVGPARKPGYFAYRIGAGKGLVARQAYLLTIEYPEDAPRTMFMVNRGAETFHGIHTGATLGDALWAGANSNAESLSRIPLAKAYRTCRYLFFLHDRTADLVLNREGQKRPLTPADGFWVAIVHPARTNDPLSSGAAVARIRLFAVPDAGSLYPEIRYPPEGIPRRHLFVREEYGRALVEGQPEPGMDSLDAWFEFRAQTLRFLGMNTWCQDLLTAGRNQGWNAEHDEWFAPAADSLRWEKQLQMVERYGLEVLPYFEYAGSLRLNAQVTSQTLGRGPGRPYTNQVESEWAHLDVTDPRSQEDARALLDHTVVRFKDQVKFAGAWFRARTGSIPVSFSDACLERFAIQANGGTGVTREQLKADHALRARYGNWWLGQRRDFFSSLRDYLREKTGPGKALLFTPWDSAAGPSLPGKKALVVTDDPGPWEGGALEGSDGKRAGTVRWAMVVKEDRHLAAVNAWPGTLLRAPAEPGWSDWEWQHAAPRADPENWRDHSGLFLTYPFNRLYTVESASGFDAFRGPDGIAAVRCQPLNEAIDGGALGWFVADMERTGPFCMLEEAHAVANGDPVMLGTFASNTYTRAFPEYARRFNAAYLALPALSSSRLADACADQEITVRSIAVDGKGTWLAVVNRGFTDKPDVEIRLPVDGTITDAATGADLESRKGGSGDQLTVKLSFNPCELKAVMIQPKKD